MQNEQDGGSCLVKLWAQDPTPQSPSVTDLLQAILTELREMRQDNQQQYRTPRRKQGGGAPKGPSWPGREARRFLREVLEAHPKGLSWETITAKGKAIGLTEITLRRARSEVTDLQVMGRQRVWVLKTNQKQTKDPQ